MSTRIRRNTLLLLRLRHYDSKYFPTALNCPGILKRNNTKILDKKVRFNEECVPEKEPTSYVIRRIKQERIRVKDSSIRNMREALEVFDAYGI